MKHTVIAVLMQRSGVLIKMSLPAENVALRVSQLDAAELDDEILSLTKSQLTRLFKYHQNNFLAKFDPEINAALKLLIWKFTIKASDATIGQHILNLKYQNERAQSPANQWIGSRQKILYALLLIGCPWLKERSHDIISFFGLRQWRDVVDKSITWLETGVRAATLVNFLVFLQQGRYLSLVERVLGIRSVFPRKQGIRQTAVYVLSPLWVSTVFGAAPDFCEQSRIYNSLMMEQHFETPYDIMKTAKVELLCHMYIDLQACIHGTDIGNKVTFEFMTRELLWHGFSEFLFFILPLINFQRIKNFIVRTVLPKSLTQSRKSQNSERNFTSCAICGDWPIRAQEIGCVHVFCYYCIQSNFKADPGYSCPLCNISVGDISTIQPVKINTSAQEDELTGD